MKRMMILILALATIAVACGDDDAAQSAGGLTENEQAIADVIVRGMTQDADPDNPFADEAAAQCFAAGAIDDLGVGRLAEIGLAADSDDTTAAFASLGEGEISDLADLALGCIDIETAMAPQFSGDGISEASGLCMARELGKTDFYKQAFVAGMTGDDSYDPTEDPAFLGTMMTVATECLTADELAIIMGG